MWRKQTTSIINYWKYRFDRRFENREFCHCDLEVIDVKLPYWDYLCDFAELVRKICPTYPTQERNTVQQLGTRGWMSTLNIPERRINYLAIIWLIRLKLGPPHRPVTGVEYHDGIIDLFPKLSKRRRSLANISFGTNKLAMVVRGMWKRGGGTHWIKFKGQVS